MTTKKLKIQIISWFNGLVLFEYEAKDNTIKKTLEEAVKGEADLRGANLWRADLRGANLRRANLWRADLWRADLREADLREADLRRADLRGADLWRADLRGAKGLTMYWHIHHEILVENLTEPLKNRIDYIKTQKPKDEVKLRLKLLKKVKAKVEDYPKTQEGWERLHKKECGCEWNGNTIFAGKNEKISTTLNNYWKRNLMRHLKPITLTIG